MKVAATRLVAWWRRPAQRGYVLLMLTSAAIGFAMAGQQNIVSNFFEDALHLSGAEFGYITAIREIPGLLLIFLVALVYRLTLQQVTAAALLLLAIGYAMQGTATSFWTVAPWVVVSSLGYHPWLQNQHALGMTLVSEGRTGGVLGRLAAFNSGGAVAAMLVMMLAFHFGWLDFPAAFLLCGLVAAVAAVAIIFFPHLHEGVEQERAPERPPIVLRRAYRYYYLLNLLDGGRQQIFFSFGLWVLVHHFGLDVPTISAVLLATTALSMALGSRLGRLFDLLGERQMLKLVNLAYIVALLGYGLVDNAAVVMLCYVIYSFIFPLSAIGASTYLRKVAARDEIAPSLAMGLTMQHVAAVVVPLATGYVLNFVGYQIPFLVAAGFAALTIYATRLLSPETQKSPRRLEEEAREAAATAAPTPVPAAPREPQREARAT